MSKRRQSASAQTADERTPKRSKLSQDGPTGESSVTKSGMNLLKQVEQLKDRRGIHYADDFLQLPSRKDVPGYYQIIKNPVALDTIRTKLQQNKVRSLDELEDLFKQMVTNAKIFNEDGSTIVADAQRILKKVEEFMKKEKASTTAASTPKQSITVQPSTGLKIKLKSARMRSLSAQKDDDDVDVGVEDEDKTTPPITLKVGGPRKASKSDKLTSEPPESAIDNLDKEPQQSTSLIDEPDEKPPAGLTYNEAQLYILSKLTRAKRDDNTTSKFYDFLFKPSRKLKDYYDSIKEPTSLKTIDKQIRGVQGREKEGSGISEFKTWAAFEEAVAKVWINAQNYNADGSEFYLLAEDLKTLFYKHFNEVKKIVPEPVPAPRPNIRLSIGHSKAPSEDRQNSPQHSIKRPTVSPAPSIETGAAVAPASPENKTATIAAGGPVARARSASRPASSPLATQAVLNTSDLAVVQPQASKTTTEATQDQTVKDATIRQSMPPPSVVVNGDQAAPAPLANGNGAPPVSKPEAVVGTVSSVQPPAHFSRYVVPPAPVDVYQEMLRRPTIDRGAPLITYLNIDVHPGLIVQHPLNTQAIPNPASRITSFTCPIPKGQNRLQIRPLLADYVVRGGFQYRMFVTYNGIRLQPKSMIPGGPIDLQRPLFEIELWPGWANALDIEVVAFIPKIMHDVKSGFKDEIEKMSMYFHYVV